MKARCRWSGGPTIGGLVRVASVPPPGIRPRFERVGPRRGDGSWRVQRVAAEGLRAGGVGGGTGAWGQRRGQGGRPPRAQRAQGAEVLVLDHFLEVLSRKPGALPGASALAQARSGGGFTGAHERFWQRARRRLGDGAGRVRSSRCCSCIATSPPLRCTQHSMRWSSWARRTRRWWPSRRAVSPTAAARPPSWSGRRSARPADPSRLPRRGALSRTRRPRGAPP